MKLRPRSRPLRLATAALSGTLFTMMVGCASPTTTQSVPRGGEQIYVDWLNPATVPLPPPPTGQ